jgi:hypothetical protein
MTIRQEFKQLGLNEILKRVKETLDNPDLQIQIDLYEAEEEDEAPEVQDNRTPEEILALIKEETDKNQRSAKFVKLLADLSAISKADTRYRTTSKQSLYLV